MKSKSKKGPDSKLSKKAAAKAKPVSSREVEISSSTPSSSKALNETTPAGQPGGRTVSPDNDIDGASDSKPAAKSSCPSSNFFAAKKPE